MKFISVLGLACSLAVPMALALQSEAVAQSCQSGCGPQLRACVQTARMAQSTCRLDCRTNAAAADLGTCMRACTDTFRSAKDTCRDDIAGCVASCSPNATAAANAASGCVGSCGQNLGTCAQGVVAQAKACVKDCSAATDRLGCLQACVAAAQSGAATCGSDFSACRADCGVPPSTTPTPPIPSCENAEAPTCGGSCVAPNQTCTAVADGRCACIGTAP